MKLFADVANCRLPENITKMALQLGCERVPDFYERPGTVNQEYAIGELFVKGINDTVFWCYSRKENIYNLVVIKDEKLFAVLDFDNYPGGLSIIKKDVINLQEFVKYGENAINKNSATVNDVTLIKSEYDGLIMYVVWHGGSWYYKVLH